MIDRSIDRSIDSFISHIDTFSSRFQRPGRFQRGIASEDPVSATLLHSSFDADAFGRIAGQDEHFDPANTLSLESSAPIDALKASLKRERYLSIGENWSMHVDEAINLTFLAAVVAAVLHWMVTINGGMPAGTTLPEFVQHMPSAVWNRYSEILAAHPVLTKAVTSGTVYTIGDVIAQRTEGTSVADLDRMRALRSMLAGLIGHGPLSHCWYQFSEFLFHDVFHCTAWWSFLPKIVIDQSIWGPIWNNTYILLLGIMQRDTLANMWSDVKRTTIPLVLSGLKLWPLAHIVTYGLIPVENRLLWVDTVEIVWVVILATAAANAHKSHDEHEHSASDAVVQTQA